MGAGGSIRRFGTIKSQGWVDGKFRANLRPRERHEFVVNPSFRGDPEPKQERDQRDRADTGKPERCEPQKTLCERTLRRFDLHQ
jgi:hypothetical protein